jgi:hypothetical protein
MKKFVKLTISTGDGNHIKKWVDIDTIKELTQESASQWGLNQGTCFFIDGTVTEIISFNETLEGLQ